MNTDTLEEAWQFERQMIQAFYDQGHKLQYLQALSGRREDMKCNLSHHSFKNVDDYIDIIDSIERMYEKFQAPFRIDLTPGANGLEHHITVL